MNIQKKDQRKTVNKGIQRTRDNAFLVLPFASAVRR
jgi:hypothetical protein